MLIVSKIYKGIAEKSTERKEKTEENEEMKRKNVALFCENGNVISRR